MIKSLCNFTHIGNIIRIILPDKEEYLGYASEI